MPGIAARSLVTSADGPRRGSRGRCCCKRLYVAIWPRRDGDMRSFEPILAALERTLNQQLAAKHLVRPEARRSRSGAMLDLACLSQAKSVAAYDAMRWV